MSILVLGLIVTLSQTEQKSWHKNQAIAGKKWLKHCRSSTLEMIHFGVKYFSEDIYAFEALIELV